MYITPEQYEEAEENGVSAVSLYRRVYQGWELQRAIDTPVNKKVLFATKEMKPFIKTAEENGISLGTFRRRVRNSGYSPERASTEPLMTVQEATKLKRRRKAIRFTDEQKAIMKRADILEASARQRIQRFGWSMEDAISIPTFKTGAKRKEDSTQ